VLNRVMNENVVVPAEKRGNTPLTFAMPSPWQGRRSGPPALSSAAALTSSAGTGHRLVDPERNYPLGWSPAFGPRHTHRPAIRCKIFLQLL